MNEIGKALIITGIILLIIGTTLILLKKFSFTNLKLPGDILIKKENFTFYFPITTSIIISLLLSIIFWLITKIFK